MLRDTEIIFFIEILFIIYLQIPCEIKIKRDFQDTETSMKSYL